MLDDIGNPQAIFDYGYDPDGNLTSLDIQLPGASAANAVDPRTDLDPTDPLNVVYDIGDTLAGSLGNPVAGTHCSAQPTHSTTTPASRAAGRRHRSTTSRRRDNDVTRDPA